MLGAPVLQQISLCQEWVEAHVARQDLTQARPNPHSAKPIENNVRKRPAYFPDTHCRWIGIAPTASDLKHDFAPRLHTIPLP